jgi:hypothetical protein
MDMARRAMAGRGGPDFAGRGVMPGPGGPCSAWGRDTLAFRGGPGAAMARQDMTGWSGPDFGMRGRGFSGRGDRGPALGRAGMDRPRGLGSAMIRDQGPGPGGPGQGMGGPGRGEPGEDMESPYPGGPGKGMRRPGPGEPGDGMGRPGPRGGRDMQPPETDQE